MKLPEGLCGIRHRFTRWCLEKIWGILPELAVYGSANPTLGPAHY